MIHTVPLDAIRQAPHPDVALLRQGIPEGHPVPDRIRELVLEASVLYESLTAPAGIFLEISREEFGDVFRGEGQNSLPAPLPGIVEQADALALFAATLGEPIGARIQELFQENEPATAAMLDGMASERAEMAADLAAAAFLETLMKEGRAEAGTRVLPYSPGYCGWHITAQRKLFAVLKPERIHITLNQSCLMSPLKSVSGVLVAGPGAIHDFENDFEFCLDCPTWDCRARIASVLSPPESSA
jgi:hypothetical protein